MKLEHSLTQYTHKKTSKRIKDLNVRPDTLKLLEENIHRTLSDINHATFFLDPSSKVMEIKAKINKWDIIKLKRFCIAKETINKKNLQNGRKYLQITLPSMLNFQNTQTA